MSEQAAYLLATQTLLTLFLELAAWGIARRRFDGLIQNRQTTVCVAAEQMIAAVGVIILVQVPELWSQIVIAVAGVVGAIIGWKAGKRETRSHMRAG